VCTGSDGEATAAGECVQGVMVRLLRRVSDGEATAAGECVQGAMALTNMRMSLHECAYTL
jgi:hypothetical protein